MENQYTDRFLKHLITSYWPTVLRDSFHITREECHTTISARDTDNSLIIIKIMSHGVEISAVTHDLKIRLADIYLNPDFLIALRSLA